MAWFLIEGRLSSQEGREYASGLMADRQLKVVGTILPVLPTGLVHEILHVDGGRPVIEDERLRLRPLGSLERVWRMAYRVIRSWWDLSFTQRRVYGLSLIGAFLDLPGAYRNATRLRGTGYGEWILSCDSLKPHDFDRMHGQIAGWHNPPQLHVWVADGGCNDSRQATEESIADQCYPHYTVGSPDETLGAVWVMILRPGDHLAKHALYWFAAEARAYPDAAMIYADDDEFDGERRCRPRFKPDWSLTHLRATNYIDRAVAINGRVLAKAGGIRPENHAGDTWELLLRVGEIAGDRVRHIPALLLHRDAEEEKGGAPEFRRIRLDLPPVPPRVSIIIPTRDAVGLLRQCIESLFDKTTYPHYEIVVVDNGSTDDETLAYLAELQSQPNVQVLRYDRPFNYSAINNCAARVAKGKVLCLLNNDTEVIAPDWLEEMVGHLLQEKVGVVGAKLYYPDGRVQHGGDTVGPGGCANHLHQFIARDDPGYCNRAIVAQELSAVTAACMVTWRDLYLQLGGLNERWLPVAFNDVDYCLRVRKSGRKVVWTPHAELYHHESVSRGKDRGWRQELRAWREVRYMRWKWREEMKNDPFYNPNFSYFRPDFVLGPAPNVKRPWLDDP